MSRQIRGKGRQDVLCLLPQCRRTTRHRVVRQCHAALVGAREFRCVRSGSDQFKFETDVSRALFISRRSNLRMGLRTVYVVSALGEVTMRHAPPTHSRSASACCYSKRGLSTQ